MLQFVEEKKVGKKSKKRPTSHYTILKRWLERPLNAEIPRELLHYASPVNEKVLISMFMGIGKINSFLDKTLNNFYIYSIDREELLYFIKKVFKDCKIRSNQLHFQKFDQYEQNLKKLKKKFPYLKFSDCQLLLEKLLQDSDSRTLETLGLKKCSIRKVKMKKSYQRKNTKKLKQIKKDLSLDKILKDNFVIQKL